MQYIEDKDFKYRNILVKHLRTYNFKHIGDRESSNKYFYAINDKKLVGAIYANLFWDWVDIDSIYYDNVEALKKLIIEIRLYYCDRAVGIKFITEVESRVEDFKAIGFKLVGLMEGTPKTKRSFHLMSLEFPMESNNQKDIIVTSEKITEYDKILKSQIERFNRENNVQNLKEKEMMFVAVDEDKFAGGIQVSIAEDSMYINRLVVNEEYRGRQIGTKLMNIIENKAMEQGIYSISLGTVEFQAKEFYEKQGFEVVMIKENDPKGFKSYKMTKKI